MSDQISGTAPDKILSGGASAPKVEEREPYGDVAKDIAYVDPLRDVHDPYVQAKQDQAAYELSTNGDEPVAIKDWKAAVRVVQAIHIWGDDSDDAESYCVMVTSDMLLRSLDEDLTEAARCRYLLRIMRSIGSWMSGLELPDELLWRAEVIRATALPDFESYADFLEKYASCDDPEHEAAGAHLHEGSTE